MFFKSLCRDLLANIQDFQRVLFGSRRDGEVRADIAKLLALPIDPRDVIRMGLDENFNTSVNNQQIFLSLCFHST